MKVVKSSEVRKSGTQALRKTLGPVGMARYLEEYDNGGRGDYTKEKYESEEELTIEDFEKYIEKNQKNYS